MASVFQAGVYQVGVFQVDTGISFLAAYDALPNTLGLLTGPRGLMGVGVSGPVEIELYPDPLLHFFQYAKRVREYREDPYVDDALD